MNTGGPVTGLTILDHFAITALQGLLSNPNSRGAPEIVCKTAYAYGALMLKVRDEERNPPPAAPNSIIRP